jgi:catechol 2,3-dioxygenase-like lactoylglutathione lyase family enzyme
MDWHCGRLIDHLNIDVANLEAARRFYRASAAALGREEALEKGEG